MSAMVCRPARVECQVGAAAPGPTAGGSAMPEPTARGDRDRPGPRRYAGADRERRPEPTASARPTASAPLRRAGGSAHAARRRDGNHG